jgi:hypothetical protein
LFHATPPPPPAAYAVTPRCLPLIYFRDYFRQIAAFSISPLLPLFTLIIAFAAALPRCPRQFA